MLFKPTKLNTKGFKKSTVEPVKAKTMSTIIV